MQPRFDFAKAAPDAYRAVASLEGYVKGSGIEPSLIHLIKLPPRRSTAAPIVSTCIPRKPAAAVSAGNGSI